MDADFVVIGSGFGGAVTAARLAAAGAKVIVLERGRRWNSATYPRQLKDPWLFSSKHPQRCHGWLEIRPFRRMWVAQGAGVGGGSLCYSSVIMPADPELFDHGWPPEITAAELAPHYETVRRTLNARPIPEGQDTHRMKLLMRAAQKLGHAERVERVPLALSFDPAWNYGLPNAIHASHSKRFTNDHGVEQGTCVHLGNCDIGCEVGAKNTLEFNYLAIAEKAGAQIVPLQLVHGIEVCGNGYRVSSETLGSTTAKRHEWYAPRVVLSAGSVNSTELLLRSRDEHGTLPKLSRSLGSRWSANANFLTPVRYPASAEVHQSLGPTIGAGINYLDGSQSGQRFFVEDDGFPNVLLNAMGERGGSLLWRVLAWFARGRGAASLQRGEQELNPLRDLMVWLGEGFDGSRGAFSLQRKWIKPWRKKLALHWNVADARPVIEAILSAHAALSAVDGGRMKIPFFWRWLRTLITVHPLGGCRVGRTIEDGVVDHSGAVFGHPGLYVIDGAMLPGAVGRNPSMTIAALAERSAGIIASRG